jgi:hypothetical protein
MKKLLSLFGVATLALINLFIFSPQVEAQGYTSDGQFCSKAMLASENCSFPAPGGGGADLPGQNLTPTPSGGGNQPPVQVGGGNQPPVQVGGGNQPPVQGGGGNQSANNIIKLPNPLKGGVNNLFDFIKVVVNNVLLPIGGVVATMYIIYSGFLFVTAQGDPKKIETAKASFTYAVIGTAILLGAWAISEGIAATIRQIVN